jgi:hypothetical protein
MNISMTSKWINKESGSSTLRRPQQTCGTYPCGFMQTNSQGGLQNFPETNRMIAIPIRLMDTQFGCRRLEHLELMIYVDALPVRVPTTGHTSPNTFSVES